MEINYAGRVESRPLTKKERNAYIREHFDIPGLRQAGFFIHGERTFDQIEERILTFFGYSDIREFSQADEMVNGVICAEGCAPLYVRMGRLEKGEEE